MGTEHTTLSARITSFVEGLDGKDCTLGELSEAFGERALECFCYYLPFLQLYRFPLLDMRLLLVF